MGGTNYTFRCLMPSHNNFFSSFMYVVCFTLGYSSLIISSLFYYKVHSVCYEHILG
jgi:hypothetical protein